jgi:hypothetical protein
MTDTYRAVEGSALGTLQVVERAFVEPRGGSGADSGGGMRSLSHPMRRQSPVRTED